MNGPMEPETEKSQICLSTLNRVCLSSMPPVWGGWGVGGCYLIKKENSEVKNRQVKGASSDKNLTHIWKITAGDFRVSSP